MYYKYRSVCTLFANILRCMNLCKMSEFEGFYQPVVKKYFTTELVSKAFEHRRLSMLVLLDASKVSEIPTSSVDYNL